MTRRLQTFLALAWLLAAPAVTLAADAFQAVIDSPHNLIAPSDLPAGQSVCFTCHADGPAYRGPGLPPDESPATVSPLLSLDVAPRPAPPVPTGPLWQNGAPSFAVSGGEQAARSTPGGASSVCLGCHDGVLGAEVHQLGAQRARTFDHPYNTPYPRLANGQFRTDRPTVNQYRYWSIPDLGDGGMVLPTGPTSAQLAIPPGALTADLSALQMVRTSKGMVHCDSCHNPHDNGNAPFLRAPAHDLCLICHNR